MICILYFFYFPVRVLGLLPNSLRLETGAKGWHDDVIHFLPFGDIPRQVGLRRILH